MKQWLDGLFAPAMHRLQTSNELSEPTWAVYHVLHNSFRSRSRGNSLCFGGYLIWFECLVTKVPVRQN